MTIVSSEVVINRPDGSDLYRRIKEVHTAHTGATKEYTYNALFNDAGNIVNTNQVVLYNSLADKVAENAIKAEEWLAEAEIQQWISDINNGLDPAHIDMGTYFVNSVPDFNTWEVAVKGAVLPFLQNTYRQDILPINDLWGRLSNQEQSAIAGQPNDVSAELQISIDAQVSLDSYISLIDEDGVPRP